jgi:pilus assembly protein CpaB
MNAKALIPLVAGLGIAGLAAKLGLDFVKKAEGNRPKVVQLWAPTEDIKRGMSIDETMLVPLDYPADLAPAGALADRERIVGRVPHTGAPAGLPVLDSMLLPPGEQAGVRVPPGLRAVAVKVDASSGVDDHLEPGCHVDVVGVFTTRKDNRATTVARMIMENVEVAAVGQRLAPTAPRPGEEKDKRSSKRSPAARAVTLLVKPAQVPVLHLAEQKGKIKLCMRGVSDSGKSTRDVLVDEDYLLGTQDPEPESQPELSWDEKVAGLFGSLWKREEPPASVEQQPEPDPPPDVEAKPKWAWEMVVQNGDERRLLGWPAMDSFQPTELGSSGGRNIFEDPPKPQPPLIESQPDSDREPEDDTGTATEPEELFE